MFGMITKKSGNAIVKATGISNEDREIQVVQKDGTIKKTITNDLVQMEKLLAREIGALESSIVFSSGELVTRDLDGEFVDLEGDTVFIRKPATLLGKDFSMGDSIDKQNYENSKLGIVMDEFLDVSIEFTQKQVMEMLESGKSNAVSAMFRAMRQKLDNKTAIAIKNGVSGYMGASGTTLSAITAPAALERMLVVENADDLNRSFVIDAYAKEKLVNLAEYKNLDMIGSTAGLFTSNLGQKFTLNHYQSNNVPTHTAGGFATIAAATYLATCVLVNDGEMTGTLIPYSTLTITESNTTSILTLLKGDLCTFSDDAGVVQQRVVLEDSVAATSGVVSVKVYALPTACTSVALTFADKTAGASVRNLAWQRDGVVNVARAITPAIGMQSISMSTEEGYPVRLTYAYTIGDKTTTMSLDCAMISVVVIPEVVKCHLG